MKKHRFRIVQCTLKGYKIFWVCAFAVTCIVSSCTSDKYDIKPSEPSPPGPESFIFVSHVRTNNTTIQNCDSIAALIPYRDFQLVLIGGDVTTDASSSLSTLYYIDSIFDIQNEHTLWALGNHDYASVSNVSLVTHRPAYYSYYYKGITFLVLDTQDSLSNIVGAQLQMIKNVTDTISESRHLIVLHHKLIWMWGNSEMEPMIDSITNGGSGSCFWCTNPNNFYPDVYPLLLNAKHKGIDVMCLAGDVGYYTKEYSYTTSDGILFRACGMNTGDADNVAIVFSYYPEMHVLTSESVLITALVAQ